MTETTEVTEPPKKKYSSVTALLMMGLGGFLVFNYIFSDMFPSEEEKQLEPLLLKPLLMRVRPI